MTEDELLAGITEALELTGWTWTHIRRSDGITVGHVGFPDVVATHVDRHLALVWELKSATGQATAGQVAWLLGFLDVPGVDARLIRPEDYDAALEVIVRGVEPYRAFGPWRGIRTTLGAVD